MKALKRLEILYAVLLLSMFGTNLAAQENVNDLKGDPVKGKQVFQITACWRCHDIETGTSKRPPAPSLKRLYQRPPHLLVDGTKHEKHTDEMMRQIITEGTKAMNPRGAVLTDEELADLIAYLHTL